MTEPRHAPANSPPDDQHKAGGVDDQQKSGVTSLVLVTTDQKTRRSKKLIALAIIAVASVAVPTVWAVCLSLQLLWAPVSLPRPNDYEAALDNVLELQALAMSEAEAGQEAFFVSHIGCASPRVWHDERVLDNFKRMRKLGVQVKLLVGRTTNKGQALPDPEWPNQFLAKLDEYGVSDTLHMLNQELWCHSAAAGSKRKSRAYITSHEEMNIYPTTYFTVSDNEACQEWKNYLMNVPIPQEGTP